MLIIKPSRSATASPTHLEVKNGKTACGIDTNKRARHFYMSYNSNDVSCIGCVMSKHYDKYLTKPHRKQKTKAQMA